MSLLKSLSKEQKEVIKNIDAPMLVTGGAGCGKTLVLASRVIYLVKDKKVKPENILVLSHAIKDAKAIYDIVKDDLKKNASMLTATNFHELCIGILRENIEKIGYESNFSIYDDEDKKKIIKDCMNEFNIDEQKIHPRTISSYISKNKSEYILPDVAMEEAKDNNTKKMAKVYNRYEEILMINNSLDYDDLIEKTYMLFVENKKILKEYQALYKYILIDEYQDITNMEHMLLTLLIGKNNNIFATGSVNEGIFKAYGSSSNYLVDFKKDFSKAKVIDLNKNYRSTSNIVKLAEGVVTNNALKEEREVECSNDTSELTVLYNAYDERDEATYIKNIIVDQVKDGNKNYSDFAVLYRTNNQTRVIEDVFKREGIPFKMFGNSNFYEKKEVKDMIAYLKVLLNYRDEVSIRRVINIPKRNIGNTTLDKIEACANANGVYLYEALRDCEQYDDISKLSYKIERFTLIIEELKGMLYTSSLEEVIRTLIKKTNYIKMLEDEETQDARSRIDNIYEFIRRAAYFEESQGNDLEKFLEFIALHKDETYSDETDYVKLMTMHSAKSTEFDTVFITGFEDGLLPSYLSIFEDKNNEIEEERRLFYVAMTRAKENLHITYTKSRIKNGQVNHNKVSRFFEELSSELFETKKRKAKKLDINVEIEPKPTPNLHSMFKFVTPEISLPKGNLEVAMSFSVGDVVGHTKFGQGKIEEIIPQGNDYTLRVNFDGSGEKKMIYNGKTSVFFQKY